MAKLRGSCFCGAVAYEVESDSSTIYFCHCAQCRKITGTAHATNMMVKPDAVSWLEGQEMVSNFDCPGERLFSNAFCKSCGSGLPFMSKSGKSMYVPVGTLDTPLDKPINYNIFWEDKAAWYEQGQGAKKCPGFPPEE